MRYALCCFLLMGTVICAVPLSAARSKLSVITSSDCPVVRDCEALFGTEVFQYDSEQELKRAARLEASQQRAAEQRLSRIPPQELRQRLCPLLGRLPVASRSCVCVAYTLAYYNIDPAGNVRRLGRTLNAPGVGFDVADTIPIRVDTLYKRHPSDAVLREYLSLMSDADIQEDLDALRGPIFLYHPWKALHLAAQYPGVKKGLFWTLYAGGVGEDADMLRRPIRATLRRMSHDQDAQIAAVAQRCLRYIRQSERDNRLTSG